LENNHFAATNLFNQRPVSDKTETIAAGTVAYIQPNEDFATFRFNAANHWIKFSPIDSAGDLQTTYIGVSIFHNEPDPSNPYLLPIFAVTTPPQDAEIQSLVSGTTFEIACPAYDEAGHFVGEEHLTPSYFKLPD
jgi:hypothetical protein